MHQPAYDSRSADSKDEELEHHGEAAIWFEVADDHIEPGSDAPDRDSHTEHINVSQHPDVPSHRRSGAITMKADENGRPSRD